MPNVLNITIEDQQLDLFPGEIFTLTLQATDFINLTGVKTDFSKTIEVPTTPNNNRIFGLTQEINSQSVEPYRKLKAKVIQNGVEIVPGGNCIIESSEETIYKITIYGGLLNISDILKELSLNNLQLSNLDFNYTIENAVALADNDTSIVWLTMLYAERAQEIFPNTLDIRHSYFGIYVRSLLEAVSTQVGVELIGLDTLLTPPLNDLVIPLSQVPKVSPEYIARRNFSAESSANILYNPVRQTVIFNTIIEGRDGSGDYNPANGLYFSTEVFNLDVVYVITGTKTGINGDAVFVIKSGNIDWYALKTISSAGPFSFELSGVGIYPGLSVNFELSLEITTGDTVTVNAGSTVNFVCNADAVTFEDTVSSRGSIIDVAESLPDISVWDVVVALRGIYALVQQSNTLDRTISIRRFEDINDVESVDWSEKLDISIPAQIAYRSQGLGQLNRFTYTDDEDLNFEANGAFIVSDRNLPSLKDIQQLVFAASPVEIFQDFTSVKITLFDLELIREATGTVQAFDADRKTILIDDDNADISINDTCLVLGVAANVIEVESTTRVTITIFHNSATPIATGSTVFQIFRPKATNVAPRLLQKVAGTNPIDFTTGTSVTTVTDPRVMTFVSRVDNVNLTWNQFLEDNYSEYINRVQQEKILTAKFNLTEGDIRGLNFLKSYYIATYGNFFYLNKVNKYRIDQSTECILASLHFGFGGNEINEWFNGETGVLLYEFFSSLANNVIRAFQSLSQTSQAESNDFEVVENEIYSLIYNLQYFESIGFNFNAEIDVTTNFPTAGTVIFDILLGGNELANYDVATGIYTFDDNVTGIFTANMIVTDLPGGAGGSTINLISSIQGVLDTVTIPNNTTLSFELSFQGPFVDLEEVRVEINPSGDADVVGGSTFSFAYISGGNVNLISDVNAVILISGVASSNTVLLEAVGADRKTLTITASGIAKLRLRTLDAVDYSVSIRLEKQSAGG